jgi:hypothetical protein
MRKSLILAFPLLGGCPYIFGPPDLSHVGGGDSLPDTDLVDTEADTDTDADSDTDTDTDTDVDTDTDGGVDPSAPVVVSFTPTLAAPGIVVDFLLANTGNDITGGHVYVDVNGTMHDFLIPTDIPGWHAAQENVLVVPIADMCQGGTYDVTFTVADFGGHTSIPEHASFVLDGIGTWNESADPVDFGVLGVDAEGLCGVLEDDTDDDTVLFQVPVAGDYIVSLAWDTTADIDFTMYDEADNEIAHGNNSDNDPESELAQALDPSHFYRVNLVYYNYTGTPSTWQMVISP